MDKPAGEVIVIDSDEESDDKSVVTLSSDTISSAESDGEEPAKAAEGSIASKANTSISKSDSKPSKIASSPKAGTSSDSGDDADGEDASDEDEDYQTEDDSEPDAFDYYKQPYKLANGVQCYDLKDEYVGTAAKDEAMEIADGLGIDNADNVSVNSDYSEVSDAFVDLEVGANDIEEQEREALALFERSQQLLTKWEAEPANASIREEYLGIIHDLIQSPVFSRLLQNPYKIDWAIQRRLEEANKSPSPVLIAFYKTHYQLSQILHNPLESYLQVLIITPSRTDLWYELGRVAAEKGEWKCAELAYSRFAQFSSDSLKGLQPLALLHFISADYFKCLRTIRQIFAKQPSNMVGNVLIEEMSRPNALGTRLETALNMIGVTRWNKPPAEDYRREILQRIADFRSKLGIPCIRCVENSFVEQIYRLELKESDGTFENFARRLLDIAEEFDEKISLPISLECMQKDEASPAKKRKLESPEPNNNAEYPDIIMLSDSSVPEESDSIILIDDEECVDEAIKALVDEILTKVTTGELTPQNSETAAGSQTDVEDEETGNGKRNKSKAKSRTVPRRSTRFVEDVDDQPFSRPAVQKLIWSVKDCLLVPRNFELIFPTEFRKSVEIPQIVEENNTETKTDEIILVDFLNSLLTEMNFSSVGLITVEELIERLLGYVAKKLTLQRLNLSETDRSLLLSMYSRWSENNITIDSISLPIHLLAAELGHKEASRRVGAALCSQQKSELHCSKCSSFAENIDPMNENQRRDNCKLMDETTIKQINDPSLKRVVLTAHRIYEEKRRQPLRYHHNDTANPHAELVPQSLGPAFVAALHRLGMENIDDPLLPPIYSSDYYNQAEPDNLLSDMSAEEIHRATIRFLYAQARQHRTNPTPAGRRLENQRLRELAIAVEPLLDADIHTEFETSTSEEYNNGCGFGVAVLCDVEWIARRLVGISRETKTTVLTVRVGEFEDVENQSDEYAKETIDLLVLHHDWQNDNVDQKLRHLNILYRCHKIRSQYSEMFETLLRMSRLLLDQTRKSRYFITENLRCIVEELDTHLTEFLNSTSPHSISTLLATFAERPIFREHFPLWKLAYRLASISDPKTVDEYETFFELSADVRDRLPTPSLMLLREAHEILAADKCCGIEEGEFLRFELKELCRIGTDETFENAVADSQHDVADITQNLEIELFQLLSCAFGIHLNTRRPKVGEHSSECRKEIDWEFIRKILPFVWPRQFPLFDDNAVIRQDTVELFKNLEPVIRKQLTEEKIEEFVKFRKEHCSYDPDFNVDANQYMVPLNPNHQGPNGIPVNLNNWPSIKSADETEDDAERRSLSARVLYILLICRYRQSTGGKSLDEKIPIRVLLFGRDALPDDLLGSVWMIIAKHGSDILQETDTAVLCNRLNEVLFPFRMSLLLKCDVAEAHLDMGLLLYQIHARVSRICREKNANKSVREAVLRFLKQSARHFQLSEVYKTDAIDLSWLMSYFRGKVAEKTSMRSSVAEVLGFYTECAHRLAADQYIFLAKISRKTQNHFEPLEIHYRVHAFVQKRRKRLMRKPTSSSLKELRQMYNHLEHFALYGVSKNSAPSRFFRASAEVMDCVESLVWTVSEQDQSNKEAENGVVENLTEMADLNERIDKLLVCGYESILAKFPHYKAAYRLAEISAEQNKFADAATILFTHAFPSKKRNNPMAQIFEGLVEIKRSDFERSRSLDYHLERLVALLSRCLAHSGDLERLGMVLNSLLGLNKEKDDEVISADTRKRMVDKCVQRFNHTVTQMLKHSPAAVVIDRRLLSNIELLMTPVNVENAKNRTLFTDLNKVLTHLFTEREREKRAAEQRWFQQQQQKVQQKAATIAPAKPKPQPNVPTQQQLSQFQEGINALSKQLIEQQRSQQQQKTPAPSTSTATASKPPQNVSEQQVNELIAKLLAKREREQREAEQKRKQKQKAQLLAAISATTSTAQSRPSQNTQKPPQPSPQITPQRQNEIEALRKKLKDQQQRQRLPPQPPVQPQQNPQQKAPIGSTTVQPRPQPVLSEPQKMAQQIPTQRPVDMSISAKAPSQPKQKPEHPTTSSAAQPQSQESVPALQKLWSQFPEWSADVDAYNRMLEQTLRPKKRQQKPKQKPAVPTTSKAAQPTPQPNVQIPQQSRPDAAHSRTPTEQQSSLQRHAEFEALRKKLREQPEQRQHQQKPTTAAAQPQSNAPKPQQPQQWNQFSHLLSAEFSNFTKQFTELQRFHQQQKIIQPAQAARAHPTPTVQAPPAPATKAPPVPTPKAIPAQTAKAQSRPSSAAATQPKPKPQPRISNPNPASRQLPTQYSDLSAFTKRFYEIQQMQQQQQSSSAASVAATVATSLAAPPKPQQTIPKPPQFPAQPQAATGTPGQAQQRRPQQRQSKATPPTTRPRSRQNTPKPPQQPANWPTNLSEFTKQICELQRIEQEKQRMKMGAASATTVQSKPQQSVPKPKPPPQQQIPSQWPGNMTAQNLIQQQQQQPATSRIVQPRTPQPNVPIPPQQQPTTSARAVQPRPPQPNMPTLQHQQPTQQQQFPMPYNMTVSAMIDLLKRVSPQKPPGPSTSKQ